MSDIFGPAPDEHTDPGLTEHDDILFSRLEKFHTNHTKLKDAFEKYCSKHDFNQPLYELLQQGDPRWVVDSPGLERIKDIAFDLLYKLGVTAINPMPGPTHSYTYTMRSWFAQSHEVRDILVAYFGQLPVTKHSCERIASEYRAYCADQLLCAPEYSSSKTLVDEILHEPYFRELYDQYCVLQSGMYQAGEVDVQLTKRLHIFMQQQDMSIYIPWIYNNYFFPTKTIINRGSYEYNVANHLMTDLCKEFVADKVMKMWVNMVEEFGVTGISDLPKYISQALHEKIIKDTVTDIVYQMTRPNKQDIDTCIELVHYVKAKRKGKYILWPFHKMCKDILIENPLMRYLRDNKY
jgi:hypothetical protein